MQRHLPQKGINIRIKRSRLEFWRLKRIRRRWKALVLEKLNYSKIVLVLSTISYQQTNLKNEKFALWNYHVYLTFVALFVCDIIPLKKYRALLR